MKKYIAFALALALALSLAACGSGTGIESTAHPQPADPVETTTVPENDVLTTEASAIQTESVPELSTIERFLQLCPDTFTDLVPMDIQGDDYRTEFRLQAFKNAEGVKGMFTGGTITIVNYGVWKNDSIRFYLTAETYEDGVAIYQTIVSALDPTLTDEEILAKLDSLEYVSSADLFLTNKIDGYFNIHYANGGISGYEIMIDCTELLF